MVEHVGLQVLGFGPAALGLFVAADRERKLEGLLSNRVTLLEKKSSLKNWNGLAYQIDANSPVHHFTNGIREDGIFSSCLRDPKIKMWTQSRGLTVSLEEISDFLKTLMVRVLEISQHDKRLSIEWGYHVKDLIITQFGFRSVASNDKFIESRNAVLAAGGTIRNITQRFGKAKVIPSENLLRGAYGKNLEQMVDDKATIYILGAASSGFSSAQYALKLFGGRISDEQIQILGNGEIPLWSPSLEAHGTLGMKDIFDSNSGEVNRFNGLRGSTRDFFLAIRDGKERRIKVRVLKDMATTERNLPEGALLINATGYKPNLPRIVDGHGRSVHLDCQGSNLQKDTCTSELKHQGVPIPGFFGTGLCAADEVQGIPQIGVNFFHGSSASRIVSQVVNRTEFVGE